MNFEKASSQKRQKRAHRNTSDIALAATTSTLPVVGIAFTLIFIVYHYRLAQAQNHIDGLKDTTGVYEPGVYYINFSATRLTTVASWASTVALILPGSIMSLYWHRMVSSMQQNAQNGNSTAMPTPYQYSLLLALRTGGVPPLWEWFMHRFMRRRQRGNPLLSDAGRTLSLVIFLGVLIGIADTVLHVTTETVDFDQISPNLVSTKSYGRQLPQNCALGTVNGTKFTCAVSVPPTNATLPYLINPTEVYDVLSNKSLDNKVLTMNLQGQKLSYLAPSTPISTLDFKATTIASRSECQSATQQCRANSTYYRCSSLFNTTTDQAGWYLSKSSGNVINLGIFPDSEMINANTSLLPNPFHTIAQISVYAGNSPGSGVDTIKLNNSGSEFFISCTTSFLNLTYVSINNIMVSANATPISDQNIIYSLAEINIQGRDGYADGQILGGALTAFHQNTSASANEAFASQYDATFLAAAASVIENVPNIAEQTRRTILAARVHKSALIALVLTLLVSALLGALMTLLAVSHSQTPGPTQGDHVQILQSDDSHLQPPSLEDVFEEYVKAQRTDRLGVFETKQGVWEYVCWSPESKTLEQSDTGPNTPAQEISKKQIEIPGQGLGLFGIPLVKTGSAGKSLSDSVSDLSDEEGLPEASPSATEEPKRGGYHAL